MSAENTYAILEGKKVVVLSSNDFRHDDWIRKWSENNKPVKRVGYYESEKYRVSTVFLGINHGRLCSSRDLWFETMIFGGINDQYCERYETWDEASKGHSRILKLCKKGKVIE